MMTISLSCPNCKQALTPGPEGFVCSICKGFFPLIEGIVSFFDPDSDPQSFASIEARAHDESAPIAEEFMGLKLDYNTNLHAHIKRQVCSLVPYEHKVLEIGCGICQDIVALYIRLVG